MNAEELLTHNSFLVSLARKLVVDAQSADDVAQQTYLAALEHPPAEHKPFAPWLTTVARNFARMTHRAERRRRERERLVSAPEGVPSTADIVAQEEIRAKVVDAVLDLDEPFRDVIVLRFYQGLAHGDVAQRLGVPLETMRSRLKKALALLARRLDSVHDGERKNWLAALGPIAGLKATAPTAGAAAGGGATGVAALWAALSLKVKIGAAAILLLGAVLWVNSLTGPDGVEVDYAFGPLSDPESRQGEEGGLALSDPVGESDRVPVTPRRGEADRAATAPVRNEALLAGRFVDSGGVPVAGVAITDPVNEERTLCGSDGRFEIAIGLHSSKESDNRTLAFTKSGFASRQLDVAVRVDETVHLGDVVLDPGGALSGRVLDPLGNPVAGAVVVCSGCDLMLDDDGRRRKSGPQRRNRFIDEAPPTAADGAFRYDGAPAGWVRLWARAEGTLYTYTRPVEVRANQETQGLDLVLEPMGRDELIAGVVLDPDGEPLPYATVFCFHRGLLGSGSSTFTAEKNGRFSRELSRKTAHTFEAADREHRYCTVRAEKVAPGTLDLVLQLAPLRTFTVAVRVKDAATLDQAVVNVINRDKRFPNTYSYELTPRASGTPRKFLFDVPVPASEFTIEVEATRFQIAEAGPFSPESIPDPVEVALVAIPGIDGRVVADGEPVAGAWIWQYEAADPDREIRSSDFACRVNPNPVVVTRTDEEGNFHLDLRESGTFFLRAQTDGFAPAEIGPLEVDYRAGAGSVNFTLDQGGSLEGRVFMPKGKSPAGIVVAVSRGDSFPRSVRVGQDGVYRFDRLTPGRYQVEQRDEEIMGSSYSIRRGRKTADIPWMCVVEAGKTTSHDLDLGGGMACTVKGRLLLNASVPAGWKAFLAPDRDERIESPGVDLDLNGDFRLEGRGTGTHRLCLLGRYKDGPEIEIRERIELHPGENEWTRNITLARLRIDGAVPPPHDWAFYGYKWNGPGGLEIVVSLRVPREGEPFLCFVPTGGGSIVRVRKPRNSKEKFPEEVLREVEVAAGETTTVDLR